ncbi:hypothetical protein JCM3775_004167 [Rhodotorula graminis]|uniref:Transcriptional regulator Ngg1 n=1 Tax=Rhodotorula graminis (strain WP1) TaxID=578459 RepID=A0A194S607_RHOGW|nr:uncharacterized protein RHOBADRAFT_52982 [Rhodotorula graminis WP1]KPV75974.1 hypothetical protein RHOBADRAFT_52982 [Rhodotorula graminis WP1]
MAPPPVPAPPPPPAASASPSNELRRFNVPPAPPPNAPLTVCASGSGAIPSSDLAKLRASLTLSRIVAADRSACVDGNRHVLGERTATDRRAAAAEDAKVRDAERDRKRKRDEDDRRATAERDERDGAARRHAVKAASKGRVKHEDDERRVRESKDKQRALDVLQLVQDSEAGRRGADADGDTAMGDGSTSTSAAATPTSVATPAPAIVPAKGARTAAASPDPDDEPLQPKPPRHLDKKKRKRDQVVESDNSDTDDDRPLLQKVRTLDSISESSPSTSFTPQHPSLASTHAPHQNGTDTLSNIERKLKEERFTKHSIPIKPPAPGAASAFYIPSTPLAPPRQPAVPPAPTPKRQADVRGDFSNAKPGQQIAHSTFTNWVDAYLRPFGEDDLAFLAPKPEDINAYLIPPLGKHYLDRWEDEDGAHHSQQQQHWHASPLEPPVLPRLRPDALTEDALGGESIFLGPLSERLMAALAIEPGLAATGSGGAGAVDDTDKDDGEPQPKMPIDAVDLEERVKRELRYLGVLPDEDVDWSTREDDEISSALRACQRLLHQQTELNEARKSVLMSLVKDRMAYQDYETARDAQERVIEAGWTKRTRTDVKKKKKGNKDREYRRPGAPPLASDDPAKAPVPAELSEAVEKRDRLVSTFKPFFDGAADDGEGHDGAARFYGLPTASVYRGLEALLDDELGEGGGQGGATTTAPP